MKPSAAALPVSKSSNTCFKLTSAMMKLYQKKFFFFFFIVFVPFWVPANGQLGACSCLIRSGPHRVSQSRVEAQKAVHGFIQSGGVNHRRLTFQRKEQFTAYEHIADTGCGVSLTPSWTPPSSCARCSWENNGLLLDSWRASQNMVCSPLAKQKRKDLTHHLTKCKYISS